MYQIILSDEENLIKDAYNLISRLPKSRTKRERRKNIQVTTAVFRILFMKC